jgi:osmoprotectant transport system permease protein
VSFVRFVTANYGQIGELTYQHVLLTLKAAAIATVLGVGIGVVVSRLPRLSAVVLGAAGIVFTIPSLALFGLMIPFLGIGTTPAIVVLVAYVQFVIIRNTVAGIRSVDAGVLEAARGLGLGQAQVMWQVELPLAMPVLFAGVRMAVVLIVGSATIAAWIGAGGLGVFITRGLGSVNMAVMLAGAIPACLLAVGLDQLMAVAERRLLWPWCGITGARVVAEVGHGGG